MQALVCKLFAARVWQLQLVTPPSCTPLTPGPHPPCRPPRCPVCSSRKNRFRASEAKGKAAKGAAVRRSESDGQLDEGGESRARARACVF